MRTYFWSRPIALNFRVTKAQQRFGRGRGGYLASTKAFKLLKQIEAEQQHVSDPSHGRDGSLFWLLPFRDEIRERFSGDSAVCGPGEAETIHYYLSYCPAGMVPICIWLISRCATRFRLFGISNFVCNSSPKTRKHVAKALRRLEAWTLLEEMATLYPDDAKVQWFAHAHTTSRPFRERLANFSRNLDDSHADEVYTPSRMPFWSLERSWEFTAPKSVVLIRRMLRRIRHWVRWGESCKSV
jgi:hypothetical protein